MHMRMHMHMHVFCVRCRVHIAICRQRARGCAALVCPSNSSGDWWARLQAVKRVELPMGFVFTVQSLVFGTGLLGITYGATSASWDPDHEGSAFGWQEFKTNLAAIMGKYGRE